MNRICIKYRNILRKILYKNCAKRMHISHIPNFNEEYSDIFPYKTLEKN